MATLNVATQANLDAITPEYWNEALRFVATRNQIGEMLSGPDGSDSAIVENEDLTKDPGDKITFSVVNRLIGAGVSGTTAQEGAEEKTTVGTYSVTVELYRHATAADLKARKLTILQWPKTSAKLMGEWLRWRLDDDWTEQLLVNDSPQVLYAGSKTSRNNLAPSDLLQTSELAKLHMAAQRRGVQPFQSLRKGKFSFPIYAAVMSEVDYYNLRRSDDFEQDFRLAGERGKENPVISGAVDMYQGVLLLPWPAVNPGDGMMGSFLRPEARLRTALTAGATTLDIGPASPVTGVDYGKYFPQTGSNNFLLVESENISYTGAASTDPANSSWATVARAANGTSAVTHAAGSLVTLNNLGRILLLGKQALMRGWAMKPERTSQERDYKMEQGVGIAWMYGVNGVDNPDGVLANALVLETYSANPTTV